VSFFDFLERLATHVGQGVVEHVFHAENFTGLDFDIARLTTTCTAQGLVDHDPTVR
jgi:hypothetical protein